jgi:chaperone modulatory protein CbpM
MSTEVRYAVVVRHSRPEDACSIEDLAWRAGVRVSYVERLVRIGAVDPHPDHPYFFRAESALRVRALARLHDDLGVNAQGGALVLDLLDRIDALEREVARLRL